MAGVWVGTRVFGTSTTRPSATVLVLLLLFYARLPFLALEIAPTISDSRPDKVRKSNQYSSGGCSLPRAHVQPIAGCASFRLPRSTHQ